jgi:hypothetical protein
MPAFLSDLNPDITFCDILGACTDSTGRRRIVWARVKGKTENDLMKLPFKQVCSFQPGFIIPTVGQNNAHSYYRYFAWLIPIFSFFLPNFISTMKELGIAMIATTLSGYPQRVLQVKDIKMRAR